MIKEIILKDRFISYLFAGSTTYTSALMGVRMLQ